jgi:hypothetical protein
MGFLLFLAWLAMAVYGAAGLAIMLGLTARWLWRWLTDDPEVADRQGRMRHDAEIVRLGKVPGVTAE